MWYNIYRTEESAKPKRSAEREIKKMTDMIISKEWYEEVLATGAVEMFDPYEFEENGRIYMEIYTDREQFDKISEELGWL